MVVYSDELYHYGVKGMRWGHRKAKNEFSNSKKKENDDSDEIEKRKKRKRNIKIGLAIAGTTTLVAAASFVIYKTKSDKKFRSFLRSIKDVPDSLSKIPISELDDNDIHISKGSTIHRMDQVKTFNPSSFSYGSFKKKDVNRYRSIYDSINLKADKYYDLKLRAVKDVDAPSYRKQVSKFVDFFEDPKFIDSLGDIQYKYPYINKERIKKWASDPNQKKDIAKSLYPLFMNSLGGNKSNYAVKSFIESFKKDGYNALIDTNDIALGIAETPIIFLDPKSDLVQSGFKKVGHIIKTYSNMHL